jgi:hypothetical protein
MVQLEPMCPSMIVMQVGQYQVVIILSLIVERLIAMMVVIAFN